MVAARYSRATITTRGREKEKLKGRACQRDKERRHPSNLEGCNCHVSRREPLTSGRGKTGQNGPSTYVQCSV
jgi:hypothetical protein